MGGECGTSGLEEKREEKTALRRARCRWGNNMKKYKSCIKEVGWQSTDWTDVAQG